jgi:hypothetical protein
MVLNNILVWKLQRFVNLGFSYLEWVFLMFLCQGGVILGLGQTGGRGSMSRLDRILVSDGWWDS